MANHEPNWLIPRLPTVMDLFGEYQITYEFYQEVRDREEHERYCQWYRRVAQQNQAELAHLRRDVNVLGFFYRWR
jgi:hypothetical protein